MYGQPPINENPPYHPSAPYDYAKEAPDEEEIEIKQGAVLGSYITAYMTELQKTVAANKAKQPPMNCECPDE